MDKIDVDVFTYHPIIDIPNFNLYIYKNHNTHDREIIR